MTISTAGIVAAADLLEACQAPVSARPLWLTTWAETHQPDWRPHIVTDDGSTAMAALAVRRRGPLTDVVMLGDGLSDYALLASADRRAAMRLAAGMIKFIAALPRPWRVRLRQLPAGDPAALMVAAALPCAKVVPGTPTFRFRPAAAPDQRTLRHHAGRRLAGSLRRGRSRITGSGLDHSLSSTRDPREIQAGLDLTIPLHRERDHVLGRRSDLDDPAERAFYRQVVTALARRGQVELTTLRLNGMLAAYTVCLLDNGTYRAWDARMDSRWTEFGAGRLCQLTSIESALADPAITSIDLMRGQSQLKHRLTDQTVEHEDLYAASSPAVWHAWHAADRLRRSVPDPVRRAIRRLQS